MPERIQMSRQRPWRAEHPDAVIVARPSKWGNPYRVVRALGGEWAVCWIAPGGELIPVGAHADRSDAFEVMLSAYADLAEETLDLAPLRGRDLACWCPLDQPCHADVLLVLTNGGDRG